MNEALLCIIAFVLFCASMAIYLLLLIRHENDAMRRRAAEALNPNLKLLEQRTHSPSKVVTLLLQLVAKMRSRSGSKKDKKVQDRLVAAGIYDSRAYNTYVGLRLTTPLLLAALVSFLTTRPPVIFALLGLGWLLPDIVLTRMVKQRQRRISRSIPDIVDLLVICIDAGLGIDQAIQRTADTLHIVYPDFCRELQETLRLQSLGTRRADAWTQMVERTRSRDVEMISNLLTQAENFGTPIVETLLNLSNSLRTQRRQKAEESAAKKSVQLLLPLVLFIFPAIFVILLGPALISIARGFHALGH